MLTVQAIHSRLSAYLCSCNDYTRKEEKPQAAYFHPHSNGKEHLMRRPPYAHRELLPIAAAAVGEESNLSVSRSIGAVVDLEAVYP
jgi:hypothetical protein